MRQKLSILCISLGIILLLTPTIAGILLKEISDKKAEDLNPLTAEELKRNQAREAEFDFNSVQDVSLTRTLIGSTKFDPNLIIGQLVIPDIQLNLPVLKGVSETNLLIGTGTMRKDQKMGEGNYPLAGHITKRKDTLFGGVMSMKKGSSIFLTNKENVYVYVVYDTQVVSDGNVGMIDNQKSRKRGKPIISLMTCYYSSKTGKRFFVLGEFVKKYPYDETFNQVVQKNVQ